MRIETGPDLQRDDRSVLTTGTFDGVHLGHQDILHYLVERAGESGGVPTVVSFDPHPREVLGAASETREVSAVGESAAISSQPDGPFPTRERRS